MKYKICILVLNSPNIDNYAHASTMINNLYASKYNYDFIVERCPLKEDLDKDYMLDNNFIWSKPSLIKKHLIDYDYLFFIDSDAIFIDHDKTIDSFIDINFNENTCLVLGSNCITKKYCYNRNKLNTGVIIVKNTSKTFEILDNWIKGPNNDLCKNIKEQECLNLVKNNYKLNGLDGKWIKRYMDIEHDKRYKILNLYLKKFLIEYKIYDNSNFIKIPIKKEKEKLLCNKNKFCIIVVKGSNNISTLINYIYASINGYDFIMIDKPIEINRYINFYDYLLIVDNSNIINIDLKIENLIHHNSLIINNKNYFLKKNDYINRSTINQVKNNIWFTDKFDFNLLNNLLNKYNLIDDIQYNINIINDNIDNINNSIYTKFGIINNVNNKINILYIFIIYILFMLIIFFIASYLVN
jgi:hypothetical protein